MKALKNWIVVILFATSVGGFATAVAVPQTASAACVEYKILTLPPWYRGLLDANCNIKSPTAAGGMAAFVWHIVLNVVEMLLHAVGYIALMYIIYGGFQYLISTGSPDKMTSARKTIMNAVIGLLISVASIAIVNLVAGAI